MRYIQIKTNEDGKVISLTANVFQTITVLNIENNIDPTTFEYNAETGELTMKRKCYLKTNGSIHLINQDEETPNIEIWLAVNSVNYLQLYKGTNYDRQLSAQILTVNTDDVLTLEIMSSETIDIETGEGLSSFILTKV